MKNFMILSDALNYIEENLRSAPEPADVAYSCHVSLSGLQKLFRYAFGISPADYISRRRITCCARELIETDRSILDIALGHGYNSPEVFTRAFTRIWGEPPASFRKKRNFAGLFPKLELNCENGGNNMNEMHRKYDISELYDYLTSRRGTYIVGFDINGLIPINNISSKAGDAAIRESLRRISEAAGEDMLVFRIGGDEFALATGTDNEAEADAVVEKVLSQNGNTFTWEGQEIPLRLWSAKLLIADRCIRYSDLFPEIFTAIEEAKS